MRQRLRCSRHVRLTRASVGHHHHALDLFAGHRAVVPGFNDRFGGSAGSGRVDLDLAVSAVKVTRRDVDRASALIEDRYGIVALRSAAHACAALLCELSLGDRDRVARAVRADRRGDVIGRGFGDRSGFGARIGGEVVTTHRHYGFDAVGLGVTLGISRDVCVPSARAISGSATAVSAALRATWRRAWRSSVVAATTSADQHRGYKQKNPTLLHRVPHSELTD
jgi:hypothetical protein